MPLGPNSNRTKLTTNVLKDVKEKIIELSKENGIPISRLTDMAFTLLYNKIKEENLKITIDYKLD